ncbi:MAG: hypothetical protein HYY22_05630 [Thaumarchaeota archaeon]|nr:hypothetical protein [Nitrososphaerota archaeon]
MGHYACSSNAAMPSGGVVAARDRLVSIFPTGAGATCLHPTQFSLHPFFFFGYIVGLHEPLRDVIPVEMFSGCCRRRQSGFRSIGDGMSI